MMDSLYSSHLSYSRFLISRVIEHILFEDPLEGHQFQTIPTIVQPKSSVLKSCCKVLRLS